jgi:dTDP-4-dehydrorhamnose 3,5-epimerase
MNETEMIYFVDEFYSPTFERVIRYNDPKFNLKWPLAPIVISDKDKNQTDFKPEWHYGA